jgi:hypothetical protein
MQANHISAQDGFLLILGWNSPTCDAAQLKNVTHTFDFLTNHEREQQNQITIGS